jgi:single-strand DNA-binding protein
MEIQGKIKQIGELQTFPSGFTKKELLLETEERYPQTIKVEFIKDKIEQISLFKVGQKVKIYINLSGSEYNGKHYVSAVGWKIEGDSQVEQIQNDPKIAHLAESFEGDLPF